MVFKVEGMSCNLSVLASVYIWLLLPSDKWIFAKIQQSQHDMESIFSFQADKPVYPFYPNYARLYVWEQPIICI